MPTYPIWIRLDNRKPCLHYSVILEMMRIYAVFNFTRNRFPISTTSRVSELLRFEKIFYQCTKQLITRSPGIPKRDIHCVVLQWRTWSTMTVLLRSRTSWTESCWRYSAKRTRSTKSWQKKWNRPTRKRRRLRRLQTFKPLLSVQFDILPAILYASALLLVCPSFYPSVSCACCEPKNGMTQQMYIWYIDSTRQV